MLRKALKSRCQITNGVHQSHLLATTCTSSGAAILNPDRFAAGAVVDALGKHYEGVSFQQWENMLFGVCYIDL